jgi:hypothetical protein
VPDQNIVDDAARELYALPPDQFLSQRAELSTRARAAGDAAAAERIDRLRKPTVAAWIVNAFVLDDPSIVARLTELGGRLRGAQSALDAAQLRELSTERRGLVAKLTKEAFARAERRQPPVGLRDEVTGTFDAALADPDIAGRLGRLQRAESWSGFGFAPGGAPALTLVQGGRDDSGDVTAPAPEPVTPKRSPAERRRRMLEQRRAENAFEAASAAYGDARDAEHNLSTELSQLLKKIAKLQARVDTTRAAIEAARQEVTATRTERRRARSALDRALIDAAE